MIHTCLFSLDRKAVKATAILFPLLGMTNLLYLTGPEGMAYRITSALLQSTQVNLNCVSSVDASVINSKRLIGGIGSLP